MGLQGAKKHKNERAETVTNESGFISSFELSSNKGVQNVRIMVNFEENL